MIISGNRIGPELHLNPGPNRYGRRFKHGFHNKIPNQVHFFGTDATNKNYVDDNVESYNAIKLMRDFNELSPAENEFIVASGNKIIYTENETLGTFAFGDAPTGFIRSNRYYQRI